MATPPGAQLRRPRSAESSRAGSPAAAVTVEAVDGRATLGEFVRLPLRLHGRSTPFVAPLPGRMERLLDPSANPFFRRASRSLFLARRGGRPVGRVAAIVDPLHNERHGERTGFFGFFESEDDPAVAGALLERVAEDLRARGMEGMRGPLSPSINGEVGLVISDFETIPCVGMPWNPPFYRALLESAGLHQLVDLLAFRVGLDDVRPERGAVARLGELAAAARRRRPGLAIRPLDRHHPEREAAELNDLFNEARDGNWGFVPVTGPEFGNLLREMRPILDPELVRIAEVDGRIAGCLLGLPDPNPLLRRLRGRLLPLGWLRLALGRRRRGRVRVFGAAVRRGFRPAGVTAALFADLIRTGLRRGYREAELSWVEEGNRGSLLTIRAALGLRPARRYRVYARTL